MEPTETSIALLVVEDNDPTRRLIRHWLQNDFDLSIADRFDTALRLAGDRDFDLFILDINLGQESNGVDLLKEIRRFPRYLNTPAIAFTAYALPQDRERLIEQGFDNYLCKPFTRDSLYKSITQTLQSQRIA